MELAHKTFAVGLTIPDNEAFTARETLGRLGLLVAEVKRATIWTFAVEPFAANVLASTLAELETIFNPNKHELVERFEARPASGEVWITTHAEAHLTNAAGRTIPGVHEIRRRIAWQLFDSSGAHVDRAVLRRAVETFLCNPAFQKAIYDDSV